MEIIRILIGGLLGGGLIGFIEFLIRRKETFQGFMGSGDVRYDRI